MTYTAEDRALQLLKMAKLKDLAEPGSDDYVRLQNIKRGRARMAMAEAETLAKAFPSYALWLISGETQPSIGQTSPEYDEANRNLTNQDAG